MHTIRFAVGLCALTLLCGNFVFAGEKMSGPKPGEAAPEVGAPDESGKVVKLSSFKGTSGVVLFFFPKADTPG